MDWGLRVGYVIRGIERERLDNLFFRGDSLTVDMTTYFHLLESNCGSKLKAARENLRRARKCSAGTLFTSKLLEMVPVPSIDASCGQRTHERANAHGKSAADSYCDTGSSLLISHGLAPLTLVTQEDLYAFHARIFGSSAPIQRSCTEQEFYDDATDKETFRAEDDDLGYYPDGNKRTLTDEQIAMFRHSEIYSILRERQVRKENLEADRGDQSETVASQPEQGAETTTLLDEERAVQIGPEVKEISTAVPETTSQKMEATHLAGKRKRGDTDNGHVHGRKSASRSTRGFVRELDSAAAEDQTLDYGEESSIADEVKQNEFAVPQAQEKDRQGQVRPPEGRRIWWPIIEAP